MARPPKDMKDTKDTKSVIDTPTPEPAKPRLDAELYATFRAKQTEGEFPPWASFSAETKSLYTEAVMHVKSGNEPRTDFERHVLEVLNA